MNRLISIRAIWLSLVVLSTLNPQRSTVFAQGSLTPPGAPAPLFKTLDQVEPRTPISSAPFTITQPGSYYLTTNIAVNAGNAITITTNRVTLDLNGYTISSTEATPAGTAILLPVPLSDIAIFNGHIVGGVTNNGTSFGGPGFANGIEGFAPVNSCVSGVTVSGCKTNGIDISGAVDSCTAYNIGAHGISGDVVTHCSAQQCGAVAIIASVASDCTGVAIGTGWGILASQTAVNCYGASGSGNGIFTAVADNCYGFSPLNGGVGINATKIARGCYGSTSFGTGIITTNASFCTGERPSGGTAIQAVIATGCIAIGGGTNNIGTKYNMP